MLGAVLVSRGDFDRGRRLLAPYDVAPGWICPWAPVLVEADLAIGDLEAAEAHAARAVGLAEKIGLGGPRAAAARAEALVALARSDSRRAAELALAAVADADRIGGALDAARGRVIAGRAFAAGDCEAAIAQLTATERQAAASGSQRLREEAVRELRRLGRRVGRGGRRAPGEKGLEALSTRERQIAELVTAGRSNREIAGQLFLSEKTVETHLSRVFGKLGLRSRAEVAARVAAGDQGQDALHQG